MVGGREPVGQVDFRPPTPVFGQGWILGGALTYKRWYRIRAVDRILKSWIKSDIESRIKSDLSDFLTGRKPLLLWSF